MTENKDLTQKTTTDGSGQSRAVGLFLLGRYQEAAAAYDELLRQDPDNIVFWTNKVVCFLQMYSPDSVFFDQMIGRIDRLPAQGFLCLADVLNDFGRYEESLVFANKALELDANNVEACLLKASLLEKLNRSEDLYSFVDEVYSRLKTDERILCLAAFYSVLFWNMRQADYLLKKALKVNKYAVLQNNLFYACLSASGQDKKIALFGAQALDDRDDNPVVWLALGNAYIHLERYGVAIDAYETLSALTDITDDIRLSWGRALVKEEKFEQAFDLLNQIDDVSEDLFLLMSEILFKMQQIGLTQEASEKASFWRSSHSRDVDIGYLCSAFLKEKDLGSAPLSYIRLINDAYALEQAYQTSDSKMYFGVSVLDRILQKIKYPVGQSLTVLDAGCGTGAAAEVLTDISRMKGTLTGVDISGITLDIASDRRLYDDLKEEDILTYCNSCEEQYDLIVCLNSLYYFSDLTPVFKAVRKALKPGGVFVFTVLSAQEQADQNYSADIYGRFSHKDEYVVRCLKNENFYKQYQAHHLLWKMKETQEIYCDAFAAQKKNDVDG